MHWLDDALLNCSVLLQATTEVFTVRKTDACYDEIPLHLHGWEHASDVPDTDDQGTP